MTRAFPPEQSQKADARALFGAAEEGDAAAAARLLAEGARADARLATGGETPLMRAAARGHEEVARVLLDAGADVSAQRADGFTPLILAVFFGHEGVVRLLVGRGADAHARTSLGTTASRWAASRGFDEMADLLCAAEAANPRLVAPAAAAVAATSPRATTASSDEVSIFSKKGERHDSRGAVTRAFALTGGVVSPSAGAAAGNAAENVYASDVFKSSASRSDEETSVFSTSNATSGISLRGGGHVPTHPSASSFHVGHFLRSWQGAIGAALLLLAFGVAVFAFLRGGTTTRDATPSTPSKTQTPTPQAAAQAPLPPATQPSPAFPTPDAQGVLPITDPAYAVPNTAGGQPFYVPQPAPGPVPADVPRELTVVSEGGTPSNENAGRASRKTEPGANDTAPARPDARGDAGTDADARPARPTRSPEPEQRPAPPPPSQSNQPSSTPATQPTPGRAKVIPWPPQ